MAHPIAAPKGQLGQEWQSGLYGCFNDCSSCLLGFFLPALLYGHNHEKITGQPGCFGPCCSFFALQLLFGCVCCISGPTRGQLRAKYGLREAPCSDCCVHFWCVPCALCQEAREVDYRLTTQGPGGAYQQGYPQGAPPPPQQMYT